MGQSTWALSLAYGLIPIFARESFATAYLIEENELYVGTHVERFVVDRNSKRGKTLFSQFQMGNKSSDVLIDDWLMKFPEMSLDVQGYFGYYSSNSVCFPDFYSKIYPAFPLSFTILCNNFCALILICCSYILIVKKASKSSKNSGQRSANQKHNDNMKKRVIYIIVTDAFCWAPIIIIACFSYTGYENPVIVHPLM